MARKKQGVGLWALLLLALALGGCGEKTSAELLVGDWRFSKQLSDAELATMMGVDELPPGMEMSMGIEGTQRYREDGSYTGEMDLYSHASMMGQERNVAVHLIHNGSWRINEVGELVETNQESNAAPLDEATRRMQAADPGLVEEFADLPGTEYISTLRMVSDDEMVQTVKENGIEFVLHRQ